ncbi:MAG: cellulase family glycosylhydrolase [Candidatus Anammoximicrobium sp.]|nr:cellulase family glycosylhydrolase [Candidatus Anammoximicrobium sp.]
MKQEKRYKGQPSDVLFEILNEPNKRRTSEMWNHGLREALAIIRQANPSQANST